MEKEQANEVDIAIDDPENFLWQSDPVEEPTVIDPLYESEEDAPRRKSSRKKCPNPKYDGFVLE